MAAVVTPTAPVARIVRPKLTDNPDITLDTETERADMAAQITYNRGFGSNQRAREAEAAAIRSDDLRKIEQHMAEYGLTCSHYGRQFRNSLSDRY